MKIKEILKGKNPAVWTIRSSQTIQEAVQALDGHRIGALLVTDDSKENVIGILSERDIIKGASLSWRNLENVQVNEWMSRHVYTCTEEDQARMILELMTEKRVRHLPVVSRDQVLGIVSIGDIVKAMLQDSESQIQFLKEYAFGQS